jgi:hypothetical protein
MGAQVPFLELDLHSFWCIPRNGIVGSYGSSIFRFFRKHHTVFNSGFTNLHSQQKCMRVPFFPHPCQHFLFVFLMVDILTGVRWTLNVILICISFMARDFEYFLKCFLAVWTSSFEKALFCSFAISFLDDRFFCFP